MNMQQIGYFLYMEEQERKQQEQQKVNEMLNSDLAGDNTTTKEEKNLKHSDS